MPEVNITTQFVLAIEALKAKGVKINHLCTKTGIDKRNLCRLLRTPDKFFPRPAWLTAICYHYHVSPAFLILAEGEIFSIHG